MNSILYAPGLNNDLAVLQQFRQYLSELVPLKILNVKYDNGEFAPSRYTDIVNNDSDWWIGISLGASFLYYVYDMAVVKPKRMTLINPFSSRRRLSIEKNFDMSGQWAIEPEAKVCNLRAIDVVISLYDYSVPIYHGLELLNKTEARRKTLVCVNSGHQIPELSRQKELACLLFNIDEGSPNEKRYNYCNVYQWGRGN